MNENITKMYQNGMVTSNAHLQTVPHKSYQTLWRAPQCQHTLLKLNNRQSPEICSHKHFTGLFMVIDISLQIGYNDNATKLGIKRNFLTSLIGGRLRNAVL